MGFGAGPVVGRAEPGGGQVDHAPGGIHSHSLTARLTHPGHANIVDNSAGYVRRGQGRR